MAEELKACPFCGGAARLDQRVTQSLWNSSDAVFSHVACDECDIHGQDFCDDPDGSEAIEWWNTRAQLPSQGGEAVEVVGYQWLDTPHYRKKLPAFAKNQPKQDEFRPLMTVAQHQRILAASVGSAEPVAVLFVDPEAIASGDRNVRAYTRQSEVNSVPLYTHPADQVAEGVVALRDALISIRPNVQEAGLRSTLKIIDEALATPSTK